MAPAESLGPPLQRVFLGALRLMALEELLRHVSLSSSVRFPVLFPVAHVRTLALHWWLSLLFLASFLF